MPGQRVVTAAPMGSPRGQRANPGVGQGKAEQGCGRTGGHVHLRRGRGPQKESEVEAMKNAENIWFSKIK